jgi:hypothetical protein
MASLAVQRGCSHYSSFADPLAAIEVASDISNEKLAIALLSPSNQYEPMMIRIGAQMLGARGNDSEKIVRLAEMERCESVVRYIAVCGNATEPENLFWAELLKHLPVSAPIPEGVMPHPSRFRIETGIVDPRDRGAKRVHWLRPVRA